MEPLVQALPRLTEPAHVDDVDGNHNLDLDHVDDNYNHDHDHDDDCDHLFHHDQIPSSLGQKDSLSYDSPSTRLSLESVAIG